MTRAEKIAAKKVDKLVEAAYYATCNGIQIDICDIKKVFVEGRKAVLEGRDVKAAVFDFVQTIRKN